MITQLCPVDLLFQRWGRLHRHDKNRPDGFQNPVCTILLPENNSYAPHSYIYENIRVLWRTEQKLKQVSEVHFPDAYRNWIENVYQETVWEDEPEVITKNHETFMQEQFAKRSIARTLATSETKPWQDTDSNASLLTRDGEMSLNVVPCTQRGSEYWLLTDQKNLNQLHEFVKDEILSLNTIPVPHNWIDLLPKCSDGMIFLPLKQSNPGTWIGETDKAIFKYSLDFGLEMEKKK